jgi:hypothetical protein
MIVYHYNSKRIAIFRISLQRAIDDLLQRHWTAGLSFLKVQALHLNR